MFVVLSLSPRSSPGTGSPRAGGPRAGAPRVGGPRASAFRAGGPRAGVPRAGAHIHPQGGALCRLAGRKGISNLQTHLIYVHVRALTAATHPHAGLIIF